MDTVVHQTGTFVPAGNGLMRYESGLDFNKDELIDFKSYIEQKQKELAENPPQNPFGDDIPVAEFSKFREYLSGKELSAADPIQAMEAASGRKISADARYSVTDEEAEYFREKYGENYDEDAAAKFYDELAAKGIISMNDSGRSSGYVGIMPLSAVKRIIYFGSYLPGRENIKAIGSFSELTDDVKFIKDVSRTDENAYKREWDSFKEKYDREIITWQDKLQESIDFERYLKEIAKNSTSGKHYPSQWHFDDVIERLEKTKDVISQIFG